MTRTKTLGALYAVLPDVPEQKSTIKAFCFGSCGKILVGVVEIPVGEGTLLAMVCRETVCPALDQQMETPCGMLAETSEPIYLRKLLETHNG